MRAGNEITAPSCKIAAITLVHSAPGWQSRRHCQNAHYPQAQPITRIPLITFSLLLHVCVYFTICDESVVDAPRYLIRPLMIAHHCIKKSPLFVLDFLLEAICTVRTTTSLLYNFMTHCQRIFCTTFFLTICRAIWQKNLDFCILNPEVKFVTMQRPK